MFVVSFVFMDRVHQRGQKRTKLASEALQTLKSLRSYHHLTWIQGHILDFSYLGVVEPISRADFR
jgi:hypothetical protein